MGGELFRPVTYVRMSEQRHARDADRQSPIREVAAAGASLQELLDRSFGRFVADSADYRVLIAAARARSMEQEGLAAV